MPWMDQWIKCLNFTIMDLCGFYQPVPQRQYVSPTLCSGCTLFTPPRYNYFTPQLYLYPCNTCIHDLDTSNPTYFHILTGTC
mmetsp:Transcript_25169/g.45524  ORF Transcript_25169/g.45524 Transcript_25169/m.45524 type:complete len:82 (-) Transcript_25169:683-928(-)